MSLTVYFKYYHRGQKRYYKRRLAGPTTETTVNLGKLGWPEKALWGNILVEHDGTSGFTVNAQSDLLHPLGAPEEISENIR